MHNITIFFKYKIELEKKKTNKKKKKMGYKLMT